MKMSVTTTREFPPERFDIRETRDLNRDPTPLETKENGGSAGRYAQTSNVGFSRPKGRFRPLCRPGKFASVRAPGANVVLFSGPEFMVAEPAPLDWRRNGALFRLLEFQEVVGTLHG